MDRSDDNSQLIHPENMHNISKRSHDATLLILSTDVLRLEKRRRVDNEQEGQGSAIANIGTAGSQALHQGGLLDMSRPEPVGATETRRSHTHTPAQNQSDAQLPHCAVPADVNQTNAFFQNAHSFNISGNSKFHNIGSVVTNVYGGTRTDGLQYLNGFISFDAQFDSSAQDPDRQCHPGTRQNVLKRLRDWFDNPNSTERIFWLYGPAGAGKSAIAQTIARSYPRQKVAGTFFFFRSDVNRNDGNRLFTTLAYQLAFSMPEIRECIAHSLSQRPDLPKADVETQFNQLLLRPFQVLNDSSKQLAPVIVIDGVDECTDEQLQQRFLKIIGDAVADDHFPLRFLIVSRPEVHIEQTIRHFQTPVLTIDLAKLDDANKDIGKYLVDEFSRIASEQDLDPAWPGQEIIDDIVYKSSGNFIFAALVIRFVGDPYCFAKTQLDIIMNLKPPETMSPFAALDQLFLEILRRVPDQDFLKKYLVVLVARISVLSSSYGELYKDDAVLMHVCEQELHAKLRRMRSLLKFKPGIDVHHKSFLDFLHDSSRSGQYHIRKQGGIRGYLEVFVDSLVRYISTVIEQPDRHKTPHFKPRFRAMIQDYPPRIELPVKVWQEVTQPLLDIQDKLLQLPNLASARDLLPCDECTVFHLLRELLHLGLHQDVFIGQPNNAFIRSVMNAQKRGSVVSSTTPETEMKTDDNVPDNILRSLLVQLPEIIENWSPNEEAIKLMSALLHFDSAQVARSVYFVSDAQKLVDLLVYMIRANNALSIHPDGIHKADLLAVEIFVRAPILPLAFSSNGNKALFRYTCSNNRISTQILSQTILASRILDRYYFVPIIGEHGAGAKSVFFRTDVQRNSLSMTMAQQRRRKSPISVTVRQIMLELAKAIQYCHSLGIVLHREFGSNDILLDSFFRPKFCCWCSTSRFLLDQQWKKWFLPEENVFSFGCIFYELFSGVDTKPFITSDKRRRIIMEHPPPQEVPENAWQLIQRCCAEHPKDRPSMDEILQDMESWKIE